MKRNIQQNNNGISENNMMVNGCIHPVYRALEYNAMYNFKAE